MSSIASPAADSQSFIVHQNLNSLVRFPTDGVFSQVLLRSPHCTYTVLGVGQGNYISLHNSTGNIAIQVLQGSGVLDLVDKKIAMEEGLFLFIPAHISQGITAHENLSLLHCVVHE